MRTNSSFRGKLLKFFLILNLFSILLIVLYGAHYFNKKEEITNLIDKINKLNINLMKDIKTQTDFIKYDAVDTAFHLTRKSYNTEEHKRISRNIAAILSSIQSDKYISMLNIQTDLDTLALFINTMNKEFERIVLDITVRGFKDFGMEGEMRNYAHMLEESGINSTIVLSLRRHEKDYIIRKESQYIAKLNNLGNGFKDYINAGINKGLPFKDSITGILNNYMQKFNNIVELEEKIGLYKNAGIIQSLSKLIRMSEVAIEQINNKAYLEKNSMFKRLEVNAIVFIVLLLVTNFILCIYLSKHITEPLKSLSAFISKVTESNFKSTEFPEFKKSDIEISILIKEFRNMLRQLHLREIERNNAETALKENEAKYRNLADLLPQSVFEINSDGILTYFNKTLIETFGYDQYVLENYFKISEILNTDFDRLYDNDNSSGIDYVAKKRNGDEFPVLLYVNKIITNNSYSGLRGIIIDITEKMRYTEELKDQKHKAEQADKLKSAFLANMSHEIRTPMNSIVGFSQILSQPDLDNKSRLEYAEYISNSSDLLLKIINDILDIAKIESGQLKIAYSNFNLNSLMNKIGVQASEMKKNKKKEHIEIRVLKYYEDTDLYINSDPYRLEQVLINLVNNAIKFTAAGVVELGYRITENNMLEFFVKDTGIGIPVEKKQMIFERFTQIEEVNNKQYEGTGLGLSISKSIIELLKGKIWVESFPACGSIFYFEIPFSVNQKIRFDEVYVSSSPIDYGYFKGKKLLIAEDVDYNFLLLREALKSFEMCLIRAYNGSEALKILNEQNDIEIVLMDMRMPVMDGYEATRKIKSQNAGIKIIATTAYAIMGDREKCIEAGCDYYLAKPIRIDLLIETIGHFLGKKSDNLSLKPVESVSDQEF